MVNIHHFFRISFLVILITLSVMAVSVFNNGFRFNTNLIALLPETSTSLITKQADKKLTEKMGQRFLIVLTADNKERLFQAGEELQQLFCNNKESSPIECINPDSSSSAQDLIKVLSKHRHYLLNDKQKKRIINNPEQLQKDALKRLYSIGQWAPILPITEDPLGLFDEYIQNLLTTIAPFKQFHGMNILNNKQGEEVGLALFVKLNNDAYNLNYQKTFTTWYEQNKQQLKKEFSDVKLLSSGVIFHATNAATNARKEITLISSISVIGIILLFLTCFRSLQPLLAGLGSLGFGCLSAIIVCQFFLKELHLITLVFGASLIGVSIDYALHFFCEKHFNSNCNDSHSDNNSQNNSLKGQDAIQHIFPAITLGLITSLIGYGILTQAPMPGLKQIALFSITGLICSWVCVVTLFPLLKQKQQQTPPILLITAANTCTYFWKKIGKNKSFTACAILLIGSIAIISTLSTTSDSIRTLYKPDAELLNQERQIQPLINSMASNQYFIIRGSSTDQLLQYETTLHHQLDKLISEDKLQGYISTRQFIADLKTQQQNYQLFSNTVYKDNGPAANFFYSIGANESQLEKLLVNLTADKNQALTIDKLHPSLPTELQALYLGVIDKQHISLVLLRGIQSLEAINKLKLPPNIQFYDKVSEMSHALKSQQSLALKQLLFGYIFIGLIILLRYRHLPALGLVAVPILSSLITVAILSLFDVSLSLFHVFALFLILGLGMDYAIFLYDAKGTSASSQIAVLLSAATSCLSFGLLSLSSTPMIAAFGLTILLGSLINFALAPLVNYCKPS